MHIQIHIDSTYINTYSYRESDTYIILLKYVQLKIEELIVSGINLFDSSIYCSWAHKIHKHYQPQTHAVFTWGWKAIPSFYEK